MVEDERPMTDEERRVAEERNGRRRRVRQTEKIAHAVETCVRALEPLDAAARVRVLRAAAMLLDVHESP
jgi:hypothetical protein